MAHAFISLFFRINHKVYEHVYAFDNEETKSTKDLFNYIIWTFCNKSSRFQTNMSKREYPGYPEVVVIALPKCGTKTLNKCFTSLGYNVFDVQQVRFKNL